MLSLATLVLAAAAAGSSPALTSATPWWEKITYTMSGDGGHQYCVYQSSLAGARSCDDEESSSPVAAASGSTGSYTKITIERRFTPAPRPDPGTLQSGDTLLGGQVMALAIDGAGEVRSCKVLAASGKVRPAYSCNQARAERFDAATTKHSRVRQAFMTILVYGHEGHLA